MIKITFNPKSGELGIGLNLNKSNKLNSEQLKYIENKIWPGIIATIKEHKTRFENREKLFKNTVKKESAK